MYETDIRLKAHAACTAARNLPGERGWNELCDEQPPGGRPRPVPGAKWKKALCLGGDESLSAAAAEDGCAHTLRVFVIDAKIKEPLWSANMLGVQDGSDSGHQEIHTHLTMIKQGSRETHCTLRLGAWRATTPMHSTVRGAC